MLLPWLQDKLPFVSARKVLMELGEPYSSNVELCSFHTVSKGSLGECGLRGGYVETTNIHPGAIEEIYKIASINLSPNIMGQVRINACDADTKTMATLCHRVFDVFQLAEHKSLTDVLIWLCLALSIIQSVICHFSDL